MNKLRLEAARLGAVVLCLTACQWASERTIGLGENIHHDDFEYSVRSVERLDSLGALRPAGQFYAVVFRVENRAKRVEHVWSTHTAYLTDSVGTVYENLPAARRVVVGQRGLPNAESFTTPVGGFDSTVLVFDLPRTVRHPFLKVRDESLMGDVFDGGQFAKTRVRLE